MQITISDDQARDLLAELPAATTASVTGLKDKLKEGLDKNRNLTAGELHAVLFVIEGADIVKIRDSQGEAADLFMANVRNGRAKLVAIHQRQLAREAGGGR